MNPTCYMGKIGKFTPSNKITNEQISQTVDTTPEWIYTRTGIRSRNFLSKTENNSDAGVAAARIAIEQSGINQEELTHIVVATCTPDFLCPNTAAVISNKLNLQSTRCMTFDINAACSGFIYGLSILKNIFHDREAKVLLICSEALSRRINWNDRTTCILFGDAAAATVLTGEKTPTTQAQIIDTLCYADSKNYHLLTIGGGTQKEYKEHDTIENSFFITMEGREVFKYAVRNMAAACQEILAKNNLSNDEIDLFIPHQANQRIIESIGAKLKIPEEKICMNIENYGNTSAASIPLMTAEAMEQNRIQPGMTVLQATFGGGFTWGTALLQF